MKRFTNILFKFSNTDADSAALNRAVALANTNGAKLTLAAFLDPDEGFVAAPETQAALDRIHEELKQEQTEKLLSLADDLRQNNPGLKVETVQASDATTHDLILTVIEKGIDLVIKAPEPATEGPLSRFFTSGDLKLLRKCPCAVWIAREDDGQAYQTIMAAIDLESIEPEQQELLERILTISKSLAEREDSHWLLTHAWRLVGETRMRGRQISRQMVGRLLEEIESNLQVKLDELLKEHPYEKASGVLIKGTAGEIIPSVAQQTDADLIVIGTVGRTGIPGWIIGNTAERILSSVSCSVLALKPQGFVSPVVAN